MEEKIKIIANNLVELNKRVFGIEAAHQTLLNIIFDRLPEAKHIAIEVMSVLIAENKDKNDAITEAFQQSLTRIQHKGPLSPEEIRKQFYAVDQKIPRADKQ